MINEIILILILIWLIDEGLENFMAGRIDKIILTYGIAITLLYIIIIKKPC